MIPATAVFLRPELQSAKRRKSLIPERKLAARKVGKKVTLVIRLQSLMMIKLMNIQKDPEIKECDKCVSTLKLVKTTYKDEY